VAAAGAHGRTNSKPLNFFLTQNVVSFDDSY